MPIVIDVRKNPFYREGYRVGMEEGKRKGREEGLIAEAQEALLDNLRARFGEVSEEIQTKIKEIRNRDLLKKLRLFVLKAQTIEEVKREILGGE